MKEKIEEKANMWLDDEWKREKGKTGKEIRWIKWIDWQKREELGKNGSTYECWNELVETFLMSD